LLRKYKSFKRNKVLAQNPSARFCLRPNCEGYVIGSRWKPKVTCPNCKASQCYHCRQPWHGYFTSCNRRPNDDFDYHKWAIGKNVQKCPKCRARIEKLYGCNHMTCSYCKHEFCWICRGHYNDAHFQWWNVFGCPGGQYLHLRFPTWIPSWFRRVLLVLGVLTIVVPLFLVGCIFYGFFLCFCHCLGR